MYERYRKIKSYLTGQLDQSSLERLVKLIASLDGVGRSTMTGTVGESHET